MRGDFRGWVLSESHELHALFENDNGPVYWCGWVLYSPPIKEPPDKSVNATFCETCARVVREHT